MHSYFLQTGASNRRRRPGLSICSTPDTSIQPNKYEIPKNGISIRTGRGHKILENKGGQTIIMGDIIEYIISRKIRSFTSKLGLWELIISGYVSMGQATTRGKRIDKQYTESRDHKVSQFYKEGTLPSTSEQNCTTDFCG